MDRKDPSQNPRSHPSPSRDLHGMPPHRQAHHRTLHGTPDLVPAQPLTGPLTESPVPARPLTGLFTGFPLTDKPLTGPFTGPPLPGKPRTGPQRRLARAPKRREQLSTRRKRPKALRRFPKERGERSRSIPEPSERARPKRPKMQAKIYERRRKHPRASRNSTSGRDGTLRAVPELSESATEQPERGRKRPSERRKETIVCRSSLDIKEHVKQLEKAVSGKEPRYVLRALRALPSTSRRLNPNVLHKAIHGFFTSNCTVRDFLLGFLEESMDTEAELQFRPRTGKAASAPLLPEVEAYLQLLLVIYLMNSKRYPEAQKVSDDLMQKISSQNRRALDLVVAKCYYYHSRIYEFLNKLDVVRSFLHARLRTATLRHDADGQATLLNLLLRNYLHYNLYDQAEKLVSKSVFPEQANNNEWARYLYYTGRIKAIQLEYSEARRTMTNALRKAPQHTAVGFKQTVHKLLIVVELLLGEIPDRLQFRQPSLKRSLMPYFLLPQAVRTGNLAKFNQVLDQFGDKFQADGTYTLIIRLRHNVIKTGVRMISLSYSRISLADIAQKLQLDSPEDAEFIVAKAIRDGVIEASINHEKGYVQSKEMIDIYSTREPQLAFHQRISFCLDIHNMSVKAMRFPPKSYNKDLESAEERREREQQDLEFAKEMAEDDDDGFP
ncbi:26S proteasome non-ATPase regulatory subunit 3 [Geospiza fortis]|uniref:26S proteasome non-ATPase regulatory subunit 3 n=1 Tax=Geospiza fortis TaxID=48883 RepID=A0A6I9HUI2_GEOFO|nr:26S proteasome non-ATPase regulatory subunit 3 [Geospiza fortis]